MRLQGDRKEIARDHKGSQEDRKGSQEDRKEIARESKGDLKKIASRSQEEIVSRS